MSRPKHRWIIPVMFALVTLAFFALIIEFGPKDDNKKDDRPSGPVNPAPVASLVPSPDALKATEADLTQECAGIIRMSTLGIQTGHALGLNALSGNSGSREQYNVLCNYQNIDTGATKRVVAQTSYATYASPAMQVYRVVMSGDTRTGLRATKIPSNRLPNGVDDGFEYVPTKNGDSVFKTPGAQLRIGDEVVSIGFTGFDKLSSNLKRDWESTVVQNVLANLK